jgi:hypothetical protein
MNVRRRTTMQNETAPERKIVAASAYLASIGITAETPEEQERLNDQFLRAAFAQFEKLTGLTFDLETGECTTQSDVKMEGPVLARWKELCGQFGTEKDPEKVAQLWREAGALLRGEVLGG